MQDPRAHYTSKITTYQEQLKKMQALLLSSSMIRLVVFLIGVAAIYFLWGNTRVILAIVVAEIALFLFLVSRHSRLKYKRDFLQEMIAINKTELQVLDRDYYDLPDGDTFKNPVHEFSQDIDLFGRGSFFQYLNRTGLASGAQKLADLLTANSIEDIPQKQEAVQELAAQSDWRQEFRATARLVKANYDTRHILNWLKGYTNFVPKIMQWLPNVFTGISLVLFVLAYLDLVPGSVVLYWFFAGLILNGFFVKKVNDLWDKAGKTQTTFEQYFKLMLLLEEQEFTSVYLKKEQDKIKSQKAKASAVIEQFSKMLGILDQRSNMLVGVFINSFFLSDLRQSYRIERWIALNADEVANWFEVIAFFDAQNSLANFSFNHPDYAFAEIKKGKHTLTAKALAHPLLDPKKAVANDFDIDSEQFFIITGANMAGKSTFLRTVSLSIVMSNAGLPICAKEAVYDPIKLITSMRTSDSLTDDESYFFSELKRLQFIVNAIKTDTYFIILDEILKGTNSTDKAIGSRKFIEKLVASNSTGIIATHDLSLCEAADELEEVKNYYFDAQIINDELFFDYTFKKGICQNMNASFLLRKMQIIDA
ncbi:MutS-related protein [Leeuwenhoekiella blandensis]|uniref:DNA mismatch repair protein mutS n=1 Tax=Leeuwenhoekiella blandensis (strain CECT 7118 / CCUG 51940 / KCTC 22103 / MED217) TaxID=398720 RepID=A3XKK4_LEEBM|nr:DNA mismatch repair protein MutS [Leeuwenhoekiella blandensis]EAQ49920.1 DNA mismatch repair protein mutS [Leeuwenhoekiella blandensis MED217]